MSSTCRSRCFDVNCWFSGADASFMHHCFVAEEIDQKSGITAGMMQQRHDESGGEDFDLRAELEDTTTRGNSTSAQFIALHSRDNRGRIAYRSCEPLRARDRSGCRGGRRHQGSSPHLAGAGLGKPQDHSPSRPRSLPRRTLAHGPHRNRRPPDLVFGSVATDLATRGILLATTPSHLSIPVERSRVTSGPLDRIDRRHQ